MNKLRVLVACETSGTVRDAFRARGHDAWSCDVLPCDADPKYHWMGYIIDLLHYTQAQRAYIKSMRGIPEEWDLMIAHPPCTYLCNSGVSWLFKDPNPNHPVSRLYNKGHMSGGSLVNRIYVTRIVNSTRWAAMRAAAKLHKALQEANIPCIAVENPIPHSYARKIIGHYSQIIQPWMFGHLEQKATCLWLKNLPLLQPTNNVRANMLNLPKHIRNRLHYLPPSPTRWKQRSKTFQGIADAMADQWGKYVSETK